MEVHEFSRVFFEPRFGLRMLGFMGLYRSLFDEVTGPEAVTGPGEPELRVYQPNKTKEQDTVLAIRPRDKGYSARISFCCSSDHGLKLPMLESTLGVTAKIEPKSPERHMVRLLVDYSFDPFTPEMLDVILKLQQSYRDLSA